MINVLRTGALALMLAFPLVACDEGPAERAGRDIDRTVERVQDAIDPPNGPLERAGRAIDRAVN